MNPLLEQFLVESRDFSQGIGEKLMQLESSPTDADLINELFRLVHTLKGNSGLFIFPEMTRVLHAGEDLLGMVRNGQVAYSRELADRLLDAMDFVMMLVENIESTGGIDASYSGDSARLAKSLRDLIPASKMSDEIAFEAGLEPAAERASAVARESILAKLREFPESFRAEALRQSQGGESLCWIRYAPESQCFFQGDDPFFTARQTPGLVGGGVDWVGTQPQLPELDTYRCMLEFHLLSTASREELNEYFRYLPEQVSYHPVDPLWLLPGKFTSGIATAESNRKDSSRSSTSRTPKSGERAVILSASLEKLLAEQHRILALDDHPEWESGRVKAAAGLLANLAIAAGDLEAAEEIKPALEYSFAHKSNSLLLLWLESNRENLMAACVPESLLDAGLRSGLQPIAAADLRENDLQANAPEADSSVGDAFEATSQSGRRSYDGAGLFPSGAAGVKLGRRAEDIQIGPRTLKVDQAKIDLLMNLIGELVVEKNRLPFLARRADLQYGVRELSREIKHQHSTINRIADEMQDAIMQVRMMAVSFVFQRFPRLVRDISRKLGKEVHLVLEGEHTEADKNIIESLADPLVHIVRNSLDHGIEMPEVRRACGKPETGVLTIRAAQESDRVMIEIADDGKGIDPVIVKRKAYEKGLIDEAAFERMDDREAVNLIFAAGLSTAEAVTDLSGRGVGMDVVRSAVEKINGTVIVESEVGRGTTLRLSLPLSMAVTRVMVVESDRQLFGIPMENVVETVRVPRNSLHSIKQNLAIVLRGRIVPLKALNRLLGMTADPLVNDDDELAILLVQTGGQVLGLLVDGFRETIGLIQKPLAGLLSGLKAYSGSALMGDGSVLMIINLREIV